MQYAFLKSEKLKSLEYCDVNKLIEIHFIDEPYHNFCASKKSDYEIRTYLESIYSMEFVFKRMAFNVAIVVYKKQYFDRLGVDIITLNNIYAPFENNPQVIVVLKK